jgi:hypothetical protein
MDSNKYKQIFKIQTINLINDLLLVFDKDPMIITIKDKMLISFNEKDFFDNLNQYFSKNLELGINNRDMDLILDSKKYLLPISSENIVKLKLQNYWLKINLENKDKIWSYLDILLNIYNNIL